MERPAVETPTEEAAREDTPAAEPTGLIVIGDHGETCSDESCALGSER